jgi:hypothetical protein
MPESASSWGLSQNARRTTLGIRAAGLLLFGLGIPVLSHATSLVCLGGWIPSSSSSDAGWDVSHLLWMLQSKEFIIVFLSSTGPHLLAIIAGVYLMRCDPRPLLRSSGAHA